MGDRLDTDVRGAKAAGMTAVWFNPQQHHDPKEAADITVPNWADFVRRVLAATAVK